MPVIRQPAREASSRHSKAQSERTSQRSARSSCWRLGFQEPGPPCPDAGGNGGSGQYGQAVGTQVILCRRVDHHSRCGHVRTSCGEPGMRRCLRLGAVKLSTGIASFHGGAASPNSVAHPTRDQFFKWPVRPIKGRIIPLRPLSRERSSKRSPHWLCSIVQYPSRVPPRPADPASGHSPFVEK